MKLSPALLHPIQFALLTLQKQRQGISDFLETGDKRLLNKSLSNVDYIENYHSNLLQQAAEALKNWREDGPNILCIQNLEILSQQLKLLSLQLEKFTLSLQQPKVGKLCQQKPVIQVLEDINAALNLIHPAILAEDSQLAIDLCQLDQRIDKHAEPIIKKYQKRLSSGQNADALLEALFVIKDISQVSQTFLQIGEAIISANLGQNIQVDRYHSLRAALHKSELPSDPSLRIQTLAETKSGCSISGVTVAPDILVQHQVNDPYMAIFKEGDQQKLNQEKLGIESWHSKFPGIAPQVYGYHQHGKKAALLFEYMSGQTFDQLLLEEDIEPLQQALHHLFATLEAIWAETQIQEAHPAEFMSQLKTRLNSIYAVHPEFDVSALSIGHIKQDTLETLIQKAEKIEAKLKVPPAIFIHGDFNIDNIIFDSNTQQISFVDLHRSEYLDYVQDLSVLIVSNYRLLNFDPNIRKRISQTMIAIYEFGEAYALKTNDTSYGLRMALGLARSFISSTRFILDKTHAKTMHFKGRFLIEQVLQFKAEHPKKSDTTPYQVPKEIFND
ncbi:MAG: aminoglycoside phosphotransferase family protein [Thiotrichales bacterium]|nr:aminoglycoside phosphotransferase family protein [Thiotrichales bacterium]